MTLQARCSHCGKLRAQGGLKAAPTGGAICKDWFQCQLTRDEGAAKFARKLRARS